MADSTFLPKTWWTWPPQYPGTGLWGLGGQLPFALSEINFSQEIRRTVLVSPTLEPQGLGLSF